MLLSIVDHFGILERRLRRCPSVPELLHTLASLENECIITIVVGQSHHTLAFIREREYSHAGLVIFDMGDCCSPIRQSGIVKLVELNCVLTGVLSLTDDA